MRTLYCARLALASALLIPYAPRVCAQSVDEEDLALTYGDKSTISIATGSKQQISRAPSVASVITAEDIKAMGATDLDEVLETVPGIHVGHAAGSYSSLYIIRGIYSQNTPQTLVLQNGIPITTLLLGTKGGIWGGYPVEHIARIEVIRGPGSALYGADAYAGVINIITKSAADTPGTQFGARDGSFNTWDTWIQHGGKLGSIDVATYLRVGHTDGFNGTITKDAAQPAVSLAPGPVNAGRDALDANLDFAYDKWRLRGGYKLRDDVGTYAGVASALDPVGKGKSERITADMSWTDPRFAQNWGLGFVASFLHYTQQVSTPLVLFPPGTVFSGTFTNGMIGAPETWERQVRLSTFATYTGFADHNLRFGFGHDDLNMYKTAEHRNFTYAPSGLPIAQPDVIDFSDSAPFLRPNRRKVDYFYTQDEWHYAKDWTLTAGVRHDRFSDAGNTTNPRLALVWDAAYNFTAKLLYGTAFRAPSFAEEYSITNPVAAGNPDVRPETIHTTETAFAWQVRRDMQVNLNLFRYAMKDIIRAVPNATPNTGSTIQNTGNQHGQGFELETIWDADRNLRLSGNYAHQRSIDEATTQDAGYAPHTHVYLRADWRYANGWLLSTQGNWVADRKRAAGDNRPNVSDYKTMDITLHRQTKGDQWHFMAAVHNLFNADVREPSLAPGSIPNDLPMPGRWYSLQADYQF